MEVSVGQTVDTRAELAGLRQETTLHLLISLVEVSFEVSFQEMWFVENPLKNSFLLFK